jgi:uncharacterized protein (TIGR00369 family)
MNQPPMNQPPMNQPPMNQPPMNQPSRPPAADGLTPADVERFVDSVWPAVAGSTSCLELSGLHAVVSRRVEAASLRPGAVVSGPTQFGIADAALWYACFGAIGLEAMAVTSEMSIRFLRPCVGDTIFAHAQLDSIGRRSIVGTVHVWTTERERPSAVAQGTYVRPTS